MNTFRLSYRVALEAFYRFNRDDGWAIASHIALSVLMALFPFLIVVTSLAGFVGSGNLADEVARLIVGTWPQQVAGPIAGEIHHVLTTARGGVLTISAVLSVYFASSGVESLRIGLNRAYGLVEERSWWLLRLESIGYVLVSAIALLALSFLVVLGPLVFRAAAAYAPWIEPLQAHYNVARFGIGGVVIASALVILHMWLPAGRRRLGTVCSRHCRDADALARLRLRLRPLPRRFRLHLRDLLRRARLGDGGAGVSLLQRLDFHLWRRAQRRDRARAREQIARRGNRASSRHGGLPA